MRSAHALRAHTGENANANADQREFDYKTVTRRRAEANVDLLHRATGPRAAQNIPYGRVGDQTHAQLVDKAAAHASSPPATGLYGELLLLCGSAHDNSSHLYCLISGSCASPIRAFPALLDNELASARSVSAQEALSESVHFDRNLDNCHGANAARFNVNLVYDFCLVCLDIMYS